MHPVTAKYLGNSFNLSSTSPALDVNSTPAGTVTTLTSSRNPSVWGNAITFSALVKPAASGTSAGTVTIRDGSATLATVALSNGRASFTTSSFAPGKSAITATYNGNTGFNASASAALSQSVTRAVTKVSLAASPNPATVKQSIRLTGTITGSSTAPVKGTVTLKDGTTVLSGSYRRQWDRDGFCPCHNSNKLADNRVDSNHSCISSVGTDSVDSLCL